MSDLKLAEKKQTNFTFVCKNGNVVPKGSIVVKYDLNPFTKEFHCHGCIFMRYAIGLVYRLLGGMQGWGEMALSRNEEHAIRIQWFFRQFMTKRFVLLAK